MRTDRDAIQCELSYGFQLHGATFKFDHVGSSILHQPAGCAQSLIRGAVAHERHVGDEQCVTPAPGNATGMVNHVVHTHWKRTLLPLNHHAEGVADKNRVHSGRFEHTGETGVVTGEHGNFLTLFFHLHQCGNRCMRHDFPW